MTVSNSCWTSASTPWKKSLLAFPRPGGPQSQLGKKPELCGNLFKMSVEGTKHEAYFGSKEGVQCSTLISSSSKKSLSISGEKLGRPVG